MSWLICVTGQKFNAKIKPSMKDIGPLLLGALWSSSSHNTANFCFILKNKVSKFKLKLFLAN